AEDGIRDFHVTGVQSCALPILYKLVREANAQGVLLDKSRREFVYQAGGKLVMEYISNWLQGPGRWDTTARVVSTYNQVNSLLSRSEERRVGTRCVFREVRSEVR